ncbi:MAG: ABC transporter ATP-binding protein [Myxococcota bacterium]
MLHVEELHWDFDDAGTSRPVLCGLDVEFEAGRAYAVTGPSGCGKTTLLSILALHCSPKRGRVLFRGQAISGLPAREAQRFRREQVGLVFQSFRLMETLTVDEQLRFVAHVHGRPESVRAGRELVERFGAGHTRDKLPVTLSGGEKQRVAIAQALMFQPAIVLADEPTAALDATNSETIADTLSDYARTTGATVVAATHDRAFVQRCHGELRLEEHPFGRGGPWASRAS